MISVRDVYKSFNGNQVLRGLTLEVPRGEMVALIGRSGLGKSVLLKHIIGLVKPDRGDIVVDGDHVPGLRGKQADSLRTKFGYLFQEGALFDSMTVFENVAFPLREKTQLKEPEIRQRVQRELEHMGLKNDVGKYPAELSGGMRKRTSLARALIMQPAIMLFDEPTTGLDPIIGKSILSYIQSCHRRIGFTGIIVTHDVPRVFSIVQRIAMMHEGRIILNGSYEEIQRQDDPVFKQFLSGSTEGPLQYV